MRRLLPSVAAAVVAVAAATAAPLADAPGPASPAVSEACPPDHPVLLTEGHAEAPPDAGGLAGLVVCSNPAGTSTLVSNRTDAVWLLEAPSGTALHRLAGSSLSASFLRLFASPSPAIPSGASVLVTRPPSDVRVTISAGLTLAQLAHDELAGSLALGSRSGRVLDRYGDLLGACLAALLAEIGPPEPVLAGGDPAPRILDAAERLAAADGVCSAVWRAVGGQSLTADVAAWRRHVGFALRAMSASATYRALTPTPGG